MQVVYAIRREIRRAGAVAQAADGPYPLPLAGCPSALSRASSRHSALTPQTPVTRSRPTASRSSASRSSKARSDGTVDCSCPQCGTRFRIQEADIAVLIQCSECHRNFKPATTVGKRAKTVDHSKTYVIFGVAAVVIIGIFALTSSGGGNNKPAPVAIQATAPKTTVSLGNNPRSDQLVKWAQAMANENPLVLSRNSDLPALGKQLETADEAATLNALKTSEATRYFRELLCDTAALADDAALTAATGTAILYVTPKPGTDDYLHNTRGEFEVSFRGNGDAVQVTGFKLLRAPARNPKKPDPSRVAFKANANIAAPEMKEVVDGAGKRMVRESPPGAVPHWDQATPAQQKMADEIVADVLRSADPEAPGRLFGAAVHRVNTLEERKAAVPRVLNAMYELYSDVNANNLKLSQLNRALVTFTGFAVNYQVENTTDPSKDKTARESCVRQWFGFWWRYSSGDMKEFLDLREDLDEPLEPTKKSTDK